jgi:hypothetical protein
MDIIQYIKDRIESFDDYFPCRKREECRLEHNIINWFNLFVHYHNKKVRLLKLTEPIEPSEPLLEGSGI